MRRNFVEFLPVLLRLLPPPNVPPLVVGGIFSCDDVVFGFRSPLQLLINCNTATNIVVARIIASSARSAATAPASASGGVGTQSAPHGMIGGQVPGPIVSAAATSPTASASVATTSSAATSASATALASSSPAAAAVASAVSAHGRQGKSSTRCAEFVASIDTAKIRRRSTTAERGGRSCGQGRPERGAHLLYKAVGQPGHGRWRKMRAE